MPLIAKLGEWCSVGKSVYIMTRFVSSRMPNPFLLIIFIILLPCSTGLVAEPLIFTSINDASISVAQCGAILKRVYGSLGYKTRIDLYPGKRALAIANRGKSDGELCRIAAIENYDNLVRIDTPLLNLKLGAFAHKNRAHGLKLSRLKKYHIGVLRGVIYTEKLTRKMKRSIRNDVGTLFRLLKGNRVDIVLVMEGDGKKYIHENKLEDSIKVLQPSLAEFPIYHYLHKKHIELVPKINAALRELYDNGEHNQILADILKQEPSKR